MKTFWILWNPQGETPPTVKFTSLKAARETAEKMQSRIGIGTMYVMRVVSGYEVKQVAQWIAKEEKKS